LQDLRQTALTGDTAALKRYWKQDLQTHWPHWTDRVVLLQGDDPSPTSLDEFRADFALAWQAAAGTAPAPAALDSLSRTAYDRARKDNTDGWTLTYQDSGQFRPMIPIVALPASLCTACFNSLKPASPESCKPVHPDTLFFQGLSRMRTLYHEQAHALRMLQGVFRYSTDSEKHLEEVIAELYGDARMIQSYGALGIGLVERSLHREPVYHGSSRHYIAYQGREEQLAKLKADLPGLAAVHPAKLLEQAAEIALRTVLSEQQLETVQKFEQQVPFVNLGAQKRKELGAAASPQAGEDVHDHAQCRWNYPPLLRQLDGRVSARPMPPGARLSDILGQNPLRREALQGVSPFAIDKSNPAQIDAVIAFNQSRRPASCPALTADDVKASNLWLPAPKAPPRDPEKAKMCPP
jgi:hypothetical protein